MVEITNRVRQILANHLPALAELRLAGSPEHKVGEVGRAESGEANELLLLVGGRRPLIGRDRRGQSDRDDVVARPILPAFCQGPIAGKIKVRPTLALSA